MPQSSNDSKMTEISDEEYLVLRAKETADSDPYQSKAWTLTAKTLFPQNFDVQLEAYLIEKANGNTKEAAKFFSELFHSFIAENGLWEEIYAVTNALRSESKDGETVFLRNMFSYIPPMIQRDILTLTAERSEDTMEHCRLMLLLFKTFPQNTSQLIIRLVDTLMTAEKHSHCSSVINCYRKTLVSEVLPILLQVTGDLPAKQLYRFLHKSVEFYLAYLMSKPSTVENLLENENKNEITWDSLFNLMKMFGAKLDWELCSIFMGSWNEDLVWQQIMGFTSIRMANIEPLKGLRQLVYCLSILFAYSLHQYNIALNPVLDTKISVVLVEAFVAKESDDTPAIPVKRLKLDPVVQDSTSLLLTAGEGTGDIIKHFNFVLKCWNYLNSAEAYQKEFLKLKQQVKLDSWMVEFLTDVSLYRGQLDEFQMHIQTSAIGIRNALQKLSYNFVSKNYSVLGDGCISVVKLLDSVPFVGNVYSKFTELDTSRHLHYLPITKIPILQYVVKILISMFWHFLPNFDRFDIDRLYGYLLILCQMSWPSEKQIVFDILTRIRAQRSFKFLLFFKYVVNVEILEEFMHMHSNEQESIKLELSGAPQILSHKRISTRGADKEDREDFRHLMKQQVCREEPLHILITQFLLEEEKFICWT